MIQCLRCGDQNFKNANFCSNCGLPIEKPVMNLYPEPDQITPAAKYQQYSQPTNQMSQYPPNTQPVGIPMQYIPGQPITSEFLKMYKFSSYQKIFGDQPIIKTGAIIVFTQNLIWLTILFGSFGNNGLFEILRFLLIIDLFGFSLLGVGFIKLASDHPLVETPLKTGGGFILGWVLFRIIWQVQTIGIGGFFVDSENFATVLKNITFYVFISSISLAIGIYYLSSLNILPSSSMAFGMANVIASFSLFSFNSGEILLGIFIKLVIVPIFAIVAFFQILSRF